MPEPVEREANGRACVSRWPWFKKPTPSLCGSFPNVTFITLDGSKRQRKAGQPLCKPKYHATKITDDISGFFSFQNRWRWMRYLFSIILVLFILEKNVIEWNWWIYYDDSELLVWSVECRWGDSTPIGRPLPYERPGMVRDDQTLVAHRKILWRPFQVGIPTLQQYVNLLNCYFEIVSNSWLINSER